MDEKQLNDIIKVIDWYLKLPNDYNGVNDLMNARRKLSAFIFNFSNLVVAPVAQEWKDAQAITENKKYQLRVQWGAKGSETSARSISKANTSTELSEEKRLEGLYISARHREQSMYKVLDAMNQHISHLKEELKYSRYLNPDA